LSSLLPSSLPATLIAVTIALSILALFVAAIIIRRTLSSFVVAHRRGRLWLPRRRSLASHRPPLSIPSLVDCCLPSVTIALVAVARPPTSSPSLLPPSPSPSLSHATLVADAMARAALALFVDRHPRCRHHCPCHPRLLRHCHHHPPHSLVICHRPPSWSCGRLVDALLPATALLRCSRRWLIVMIIRRFQTQGIHQRGGRRGHTEEPVKSALSLAGRCVHGEPTGEPTCGNSMVGEAGTRMSYHSSGGALIASRRPSLRRLAMVASCVLC
jgi:hypothetical protein